MIQYKPRGKTRNADTIENLRSLADGVSLHEMRKIVERDAALKLILLLPEAVLDQALAVGRALQACAKSRRSALEDREEDCRRP